MCCDYCEQYFLDMCEITKDVAYKFCMEKAHCVCNSVSKVRVSLRLQVYVCVFQFCMGKSHCVCNSVSKSLQVYVCVFQFCMKAFCVCNSVSNVFVCVCVCVRARARACAFVCVCNSVS